MYIWLVTRPDSADYDEYDAFVVVADSEHDARHSWPDVDYVSHWNGAEWVNSEGHRQDCFWPVKPNEALVKCIGEAAPGTKRGVILASFNGA